LRITLEDPATATVTQEDPVLAIYRATTVAFLRKYFRMAIELGHLPSLLGREFFRTHVTLYGTITFEDAVIFTHDVERCLNSLAPPLQTVIARCVFQEYTQGEAAELLGWSRRTVIRRYGEAVDRLTESFSIMA
jgi:Sigma-70, region 4